MAGTHVARGATARMVCALLGTTALLGILAAPAQAQVKPARANKPGLLAQNDAVKIFSIAAQPLIAALRQFADQSGLQLAYATDDLQGLTTRGVSGPLAPEDALKILLAGSGAAYRFTAANTVTLSRAPGIGVTTLAPVTVEASRETAWGPVTGFVAHRSAAGTKTDTPIIETPQSISVITRDQMEAQGVQGIGSALRYTAGVASDTRGPVGRHDVIYSRGFGGFSVEYQDGMRLLAGNYAIAQLDPYNLERIEVLRGPASVLYGQNNPGGIVNLVSKRPTAEPYHEIQLQTGSFNRKQGAFDLSGPVDGEGRLLYRLTGLARDSNTQVDYTEEQRVSIAPALTWRPDGDTSLTILGRYQREPEGGYFGFVPAQGTFLPNPNGKISSSFYDGDPSFEDFDRKVAAIGYLFEHRLDDVFTLRQNTRYMRIETDWARVASRGLQANLRTLNRQAVTDEESLNAFTLDNQAQAKFSTGALGHTFLFGVDFQRSSSDIILGAGAAPTLDILNPIYNRTIARPPIIQSTDQTQNQIGLYAQDQIQFGQWRLLLGGRHDWADSDTQNRLTATETTKSDHAFTGRAGLVYLFDNGLAPYVSYAESFEPTSGSDFSGAPFKPTTGRQYEAGIKYQPTGFDSFITVAAFELTQQNVLTTDPDHVNFSIQTGEVQARGVEVEGKMSLAAGLSVTAAYTFLDAEVTKSNTANLGKRPISIPEHTASLWADYTFQRGPWTGAGVGAGVRYVGPTYGNATNTVEVPDYTLFDAGFRYDLERLSNDLKGVRFSVNAANLFDHEHVASCSNAPTLCYYGLRRTVYATLSYRW